MSGACVQWGESAQADAGMLASGLPTTRASEFADLESTVSFSEPAPAYPEPERDFVGAADVLLGTWTEPNCDPADSDTWTYSPGGCVTLVIARSASSGIQGRVSLRNEVDFSPDQLNWQAFAPANDPDVGYPVEVGPEHYAQLGASPGFGPYTLLDPFFDGTRLRFWLAPMELWEGWCKLQHSYHVPGGEPPYQCVPDGAAYGDPKVDYGKLVLCTSAWSAGSCELQDCAAGDAGCPEPVTIGCSCWSETGYLERPECSVANCRCDEHGCTANWYENRFDVEATLDGDVITVRAGWNPKRPGAAMATLVRESTP